VKDNNLNKSLLRAISVIKSFTPDEQELGTADIARKVRIPLTTAHRTLATLTKGGLLEQNASTGKYRIGPLFYMQGSLYLRTTDIFKAAEPVTKALNDLTGEAIPIAILNRGNVVLIMKEESKYDFRVATHVGSILVAHASAMGKALLSELTETELDSIIPEEGLRQMTRNTIATKTELKRELEQIRKTGISFDLEGNYDGVVGIASVIRDASGRAVAAISIPVPVFRFNEAIREFTASLVRMGSSLISYRLGYRDTDNPVRDIQEIRSWWKQNQSALTQ
jgi:DNA-binding IclR family transcriptional regulator